MNRLVHSAKGDNLLISTVTAVYLVIASGDPGRQPARFTFDSFKACAEAREEMFKTNIWTDTEKKWAICMGSRHPYALTASPRSSAR